jgi:hypothetical protein
VIGRRQVLLGAGAAAFAPALAAVPAHRIYELRIYQMQPGQRDALVDLFDRVFVAAHAALGMRILGTFHDLDEPDHLVWLRSFPDMVARGRMLEAFYSGPVWQANRAAANATMIDASDVYMLRPIGRGLTLSAADGSDHGRAMFTADVHELSAANVRAARRADLLAGFESEPSPNNFPRLPVHDERVVVALQRFEAERPVPALSGLTAPMRRLRLRSTPRSLLQ